GRHGGERSTFTTNILTQRSDNVNEKTKHSPDALMLTVKEFRQRMKLSEPTALRMIHQPGFPMIRAGKKILIPVAQLEKWLEERARGGE
ncbi:helix-turn-helix domain-containing protein, partial [Eubacteriales bacterium OttesenSCG-928-A19]|nr:helix-turn-helix domain-containing protein [Eubacteriales bacterium OttesenSCG-928-A19]